MTVTVSRLFGDKTLLYAMNRATRAGTRGDGGDPVPRVHASAGHGAGAALNITALVSEEVKAKALARGCGFLRGPMAGSSCQLNKRSKAKVGAEPRTGARGRGA